MPVTKHRRRILVVDDDPATGKTCHAILESCGYEVSVAKTASGGLEAAASEPFDLILLDIRLPDYDGIELLRRIRERRPAGCPIVMMTQFGSVESAVRSMKHGAADYIQKPFDLAELRRVAEEHLAGPGPDEAEPQREKLRELGLIGDSQPMRDVFALVERLARTDATVVIYGESGTGKEVVARAIHELGPRSAEPFIPVDCAALASSIVESELFGHVRGAFTGAESNREGLLRLAGRGTIFMDEIVELSPETQAKLLRALQEKQVRPVGAERYVAIEARVLAASNRDLLEEVEKGRFRADLFYRLHVAPVHVPPLRERREDIPALVRHFLATHATEATPARSIAPAALDALCAHDWPGNVRQLENAVHRALILCDEAQIEPAHLPSFLFEGPRETGGVRGDRDLLAQAERNAILQALKQSRGNKRAAARRLGISKTTLYRKLKEFGID